MSLMIKSKKSLAIKSVSRCAEVLSCIGEGKNSTTEIAEYCQLNKSSVYRLVKALNEANLIIYNPISRKYFLGDVIAKLVSRPQITHDYLISCSQEEMQHLSDLTGETINLSTLIGIKYASLFAIASKNDLRVVENIRRTSAVNAGAAGKVLLSQLKNNELKIALKNLKFEPATEYTVVDKDELVEQLKQTRQAGFNVCANEKIIGSMGIAAPINNYVLPVSLSIIGPEVRMKPKVKELTDALLTSAFRISQNLKTNRQ